MRDCTLFTIFFSLLFLSSCITDDVNVKMGYLETQCADPWAEFGNEISDIKAFFEERDVDARSIKRNKNVVDAEQFAACTSKTGDEFEVMVNPDDSFFLRTIGFYLK
jgi:hypothetical protein